MAFKLFSSGSIRDGTFVFASSGAMYGDAEIKRFLHSINYIQSQIYEGCFDCIMTMWITRDGVRHNLWHLSDNLSLVSAEMSLDVESEVVRAREGAAADVAFERFDAGVFPLRDCSEQLLKGENRKAMMQIFYSGMTLYKFMED